MDQYTHLKPMPDSIGDKTASVFLKNVICSVHINPISLEAEISTDFRKKPAETGSTVTYFSCNLGELSKDRCSVYFSLSLIVFLAALRPRVYVQPADGIGEVQSRSRCDRDEESQRM